MAAVAVTISAPSSGTRSRVTRAAGPETLTAVVTSSLVVVDGCGHAADVLFVLHVVDGVAASADQGEFLAQPLGRGDGGRGAGRRTRRDHLVDDVVRAVREDAFPVAVQ